MLNKYSEWHGTIDPEEFRQKLAEAHKQGHLRFEPMEPPHEHAPGYVATEQPALRASQIARPQTPQTTNDPEPWLRASQIARKPWMPPRPAPPPPAKPAAPEPEKAPEAKAEPSKPKLDRKKIADRIRAGRQKLAASEQARAAMADENVKAAAESPKMAKEAEGKIAANHVDHPPGTFTPLDPSLIHSDPKRFQYKLNTSGKAGTTDKRSRV